MNGQGGNGENEYKPLFNEIELKGNILGNEFKVKCLYVFIVYNIEPKVSLFESKSPLSYVLIKKKKNLANETIYIILQHSVIKYLYLILIFIAKAVSRGKKRSWRNQTP